MNRIDWDDYFMTMAYLASMRSKDESTHIGAVLVGKDKEVISTGYNSFPRHINDSKAERQERPEKYYWFEHAERNAIYNCALQGASTRGTRMYTNGIPCMDCARAIVQSGITLVIVDKKWGNQQRDKWDEHAQRSLQLFKEAHVKVHYWDGDLIDIVKFQRGQCVA